MVAQYGATVLIPNLEPKMNCSPPLPLPAIGPVNLSTGVEDWVRLNHGVTYTGFHFATEGVLTGLLCVTGLAANILACPVLLYRRSLPVAVLLVCLSCSDTFNLAYLLLSKVIPSFAYHFRWCGCFKGLVRAQVYLWPVGSAVHMMSVWLTVAVSLDRYRAICQPLKIGRKMALKKTVASLFAVCIVFNIPRFFHHQIVNPRVDQEVYSYPCTENETECDFIQPPWAQEVGVGFNDGVSVLDSRQHRPNDISKANLGKKPRFFTAGVTPPGVTRKDSSVPDTLPIADRPQITFSDSIPTRVSGVHEILGASNNGIAKLSGPLKGGDTNINCDYQHVGSSNLDELLLELSKVESGGDSYGGHPEETDIDADGYPVQPTRVLLSWDDIPETNDECRLDDTLAGIVGKSSASLGYMGTNPFYRYIYFIGLSWVVLYVAPLSLLVGLNTRLFVEIHKARKQHAALTRTEEEKRNVSATINVVAVVTVFVACQSPEFVDVVISYPALGVNMTFLSYYSCVCCVLLALNYSCNFLIYSLFYKKFRQTARHLYCGKAAFHQPTSSVDSNSTKKTSSS